MREEQDEEEERKKGGGDEEGDAAGLSLLRHVACTSEQTLQNRCKCISTNTRGSFLCSAQFETTVPVITKAYCLAHFFLPPPPLSFSRVVQQCR